MITDQKTGIVGGTAGIGLALAGMAADAGAEVHLGGISRNKLEQALRQLNGKVKGGLVDARDEDSIHRFFVQAGELHHLVSTIGSPYQAIRVLDGRRADYEELFTVKYWGQFLIAKHAARQLVANGSITFTSGVLSQRPAECFSVLASVNARVEALARTLALEFAPRRVNVVCPGFVDAGELTRTCRRKPAPRSYSPIKLTLFRTVCPRLRPSPLTQTCWRSSRVDHSICDKPNESLP